MKIVVFGASGKIGRLLVLELLKNGHTVTAFVHSTAPFTAHPHLNVIKGDVHNQEDVAHALEKQEIVISTLGSWHTKTKDIVSSAIANIVPIMEQKGMKRIVTLTGSGARATGDKKSLLESFGHAVFSVIAGKIVRDSEEHIKLLEQSSLDYTVLRSPVMTNKPSNKYELSTLANGAIDTISRTAITAALKELVTSTRHTRAAPYIHQR